MDLLTLYLLAVGTLLASAGMTLWDARSNRQRRRPLGWLAAGYSTLAVGCVSVLYRHEIAGYIGSALSNLIMLAGYLLILAGAGALSGRRHRIFAAAVLVLTALTWVVLGAEWQNTMWNYISAVPIAVISGMTTWAIVRCEPVEPLPSRVLVIVITGIHTVVYAARATILPWLVAAFGPAVQAVAGKLTIYEGVLYSVLLPMALLKLVREETHATLLHEASTDYLTRLGNRKKFFEEGERILRDMGGRGPVAVLLFDLDQFKAINDRHGHQAGDEVLKSFAEVAQGVLSPHATLARIGGEEFAALLAGYDAVKARTLGESVARRFAEAIVSRNTSARIPATVSIGLSYFEEKAPTLIEGLAAADQALYRAKSLGGNRLELAQPAPGAA